MFVESDFGYDLIGSFGYWRERLSELIIWYKCQSRINASIEKVYLPLLCSFSREIKVERFLKNSWTDALSMSGPSGPVFLVSMLDWGRYVFM